MLALYNGEKHTIKLYVYRQRTNVLEDFSRADIALFLVGDGDKLPIGYELEDNVLTLTIDEGYAAAVYDIELVWSKDGAPLKMHHLNSRSYNFCKVQNAFTLTENSAEATNLASGQVIEIKTYTASYGYDGMDAYTLAVIKGLTDLKESEWVGSLAELNEKIDETLDDFREEAEELETELKDDAAATKTSLTNSVSGAVQGANTAAGNANSAAISATTAANYAKSATTDMQSKAATAVSDAETAATLAQQEAQKASALNSEVQTAEAQRVQAESDRAYSETVRTANEEIRQTAETQRQQAEEKRVAAESGRVTAETLRSEAEEVRESAESKRAETFSKNEQQREANESQRILNENVREENEVKRVAAESERDAAFEASQSERATAFEEQLTEQQSSWNTQMTEQQSTFDSKEEERDAAIASVTEYEKEVQSEITERKDTDFIARSIRNGGINNSANLYKVTCALVQCNSTKIRFETNRPLPENCIYLCGYAIANAKATIGNFPRYSYTGKIVTVDASDSGTESVVEFNISSYASEGIAYAAFEVLQYNTEARELVALRTTDFDGYYIRVKSVDVDVIENATNIATNTTNIAKLYNAEGYTTAIRNGGIGNSGNAYKVVGALVNCVNAKRIRFETSRPLPDNCIYLCGYVLGSNVKTAGTYPSSKLDGLIKYTDAAGSGTASIVEFDISSYTKRVAVASVEVLQYNTETQALVALRTTDFDGYYFRIRSIEEESEDEEENVVFSRNQDKIPMLVNACRQNRDSNGSKDFQMAIITDTHGETLAIQNAVKATNGFSTIDALIHCGDIQATTFKADYAVTAAAALKECTKPWLVVCGNHDVGNTYKVYYGATEEMAYNAYIKPMVDNGVLVAGEYEEGKCYYYHDFATRKVRVIVPFEYDSPLDLVDNDYWEPVAYDASYPAMTMGTTYTYDSENDVIVNCGGYTDYSFKLKKNVTTESGQYGTDSTTPRLKIGRNVQVIRETQAQWLIDTLNSTPEGYGVLIATHNPFTIKGSNQTALKFAVDTAYAAKGQGQFGMSTDLIADIVNAFINKTTLEGEKVIVSAKTYLNTNDDGDGVKYYYKISADFSGRNDCYFAGYVGGHAHKDLVFKHDTYTGQWGVNPICGMTDRANSALSDVARPRVDGIAYDAITTVSFKQGRLALVRIGNTWMDNGNVIDFEVIDTSK